MCCLQFDTGNRNQYRRIFSDSCLTGLQLVLVYELLLMKLYSETFSKFIFLFSREATSSLFSSSLRETPSFGLRVENLQKYVLLLSMHVAKRSFDIIRNNEFTSRFSSPSSSLFDFLLSIPIFAANLTEHRAWINFNSSSESGKKMVFAVISVRNYYFNIKIPFPKWELALSSEEYQHSMLYLVIWTV